VLLEPVAVVESLEFNELISIYEAEELTLFHSGDEY